MAERGMPGRRRLNHLGVAVPDDDWMAENPNVHPRSVLRGLTFLRCADGAHIERFEYQACHPTV